MIYEASMSAKAKRNADKYEKAAKAREAEAKKAVADKKSAEEAALTKAADEAEKVAA